MPSATSTSVPLRSPKAVKQYPQAKQTQRPSFENYIPFGSLSLTTIPSSVPSSNDWHELEAAEVATICPDWSEDLALLVFSAWCRVLTRSIESTSSVTLRVFILPDDVARAEVSRNNGRGRNSLRVLLQQIDRSPEGWNGEKVPNDEPVLYLKQEVEDDSLFYIFNTLSSPDPDPDSIEEAFSSQAMQDILNGKLLDQGLRTDLYLYQRRSAAAMVQRECQPRMQSDPRLEQLIGPQHNSFYIDRATSHFYLSERWFHEPRGGILAETMGYGKTLICLAMILATKGHLPEVPPDEVNDLVRNRPQTGCRSLAMQAAAAAARFNVQWRLWFEAQCRADFNYNRCIKLLDDNAATYTVEKTRGRSRNPQITKNTYRLSPTTLVVVPANLLQQWEWQLKEHIDSDALSVVVVDERSIPIPDAAQMHHYDLIIMSGERFEEEINPLRGNHTDPDSMLSCCCSDLNRRRLCQQHPYKSPLLEIHFLRFVVDEGVRFMSSESKTQAMYALQAIRVERKWIVSGTPARSLIGAEVELAAEQNAVEDSDHEFTQDLTSSIPDTSTQADVASLSKLQHSLVGRKKTADIEEESRTISRLGTVVKSFLELQPWASPESNDGAYWNTYFLPNKNGTRKLLSLRNVLNNIVIRHRYEDLMSDLQLPNLENRYVRLEPSFLDKLSMNLFFVQLTTNSVTSERKDQDYMFHPRNRKSLEYLVRNLRHSAFFWCGLKPQELETTRDISKKYLEKLDISITQEDRQALREAIHIADLALANPAWRAFAETGEMGLFVQNFPQAAKEGWALCKSHNAQLNPFLLSATALRIAQRKVEDSLYSVDPLATLDTGLPPKEPATIDSETPESRSSALKTAVKKSSARYPNKINRNGVNFHVSSDSTKQVSLSTISKSAVEDSKISVGDLSASNRPTPQLLNVPAHPAVSRARQCTTQKSILKSVTRKPDVPPAYHALANSKLVGTPSAKLSYLLDRIIDLYHSEKILVFYEGDDIAYYCAQALEILEIPHRIYAAGIKKQLRNQYQNEFNSNESIRVMLVDLNQAALGLHLAAASRVFFINPVWQPGLEAQAIKRAHRIGSKRDIKTETLVLKGTVEEDLLQRRESMNAEEHRKASRSLLDDAHMKRVLQEARFLPFLSKEIADEQAQLATLPCPRQIFARSIAAAYQDDEVTLCALSTESSQIHTAPQYIAPIIRSDATESETPSKESPEKRSVKRKLVFVDELEERKAVKAQKRTRPSVEHADYQATEVPDNSLQRRIRFADDENMPLHVTHEYNWPDEVMSELLKE